MSRTWMVLCVAGSTIPCLPASARPSEWNAGVSGLWTDPTRWNGGVPNSSTATALVDIPGVYTVNMNVGVLLLGLDVSASGALVDIASASFLNYYGTSLHNGGSIRVNSSAGGGNTSISFQDSCTITGPGALTLNANSGNLDTAYLTGISGKIVTNSADHIIRGTGNIYVPVINNGQILADVSGRVLQLFSTAKTNNAVIQAQNGGRLVVSGITINQDAGATIASDGTDLSLVNATVSGGQISLTAGAHAVITGQLTLKGGVQSAGPLDVSSGQSLVVAQPDLLHQGRVTVNPTAGGGGTLVRFEQTGSLGPSTEILLNATANLDTAYLQGLGNATLTVPPTATIHGSGNIYLPLVNNGLVHADSAGRVLQLFNSSKVNNATIRASDGGKLLVNAITLTQGAGGLITSDQTDLSLVSTTLSGGSMSVTGGAHAVITSTLVLKDGIATSGPLDIPSGQSLYVTQPNLIHTGTVTVNPSGGGGGTMLRFDQSGTIIGPAEIVLNASANLDTAYIVGLANATLTVPPTTTIRGTGNIYIPLINNGLIHADRPGKTLQIFSTGKVNNATIKATGGGKLQVNGITLTQGPAGTLSSDGTDLPLISTTISGGSVSVTGGAHAVVTGSVALKGGVATSGPFDVPSGQSLLVSQPDLIHAGTITVNSTAGAGGTNLRFDQSGTIVGPTEIVLNASANLDTAIIQGLANVTLTVPPTATIRGTGNLYIPFINNGLIHADRAGRALQLLSTPKTNNAIIKATGGGQILISGITLTQGPTGAVTSDGTDLSLTGATVSGGQMEVTSGGVFRVAGSVIFSGGVNYFGPLSIPNGQSLNINQAATLHSGTTTINQTAGGGGTILRFGQTGTIDGGELLLNASANLDTAYLHAQSGVTTLGGQETLRGRGRLYGAFINNGTTSVGTTPGAVAQIDCQGSYVMGADSVLEVDVGGTSPAQFDRVTCSGAVTVGGTLRVRLTNGYEPLGGETFDIVSGTSRAGSFSNYDIDRYPEGAKRFAVRYLPGKVQLLARGCTADFDGSGFVDTDDFTDFVLAFEAGTDDADFDGTGFVDTDDFTAFTLAFESGC